MTKKQTKKYLKSTGRGSIREVVENITTNKEAIYYLASWIDSIRHGYYVQDKIIAEHDKVLASLCRLRSKRD